MIYVVKNPNAQTRAICSPIPTGAAGEEEMTDADFIAWRDSQPEIKESLPAYRVSKDTIIGRIPAESLSAVMGALASQSAAEQFVFLNSAWFWSDNAQLRGLCTALGLDADALLARDPFLF